MKKNCVIFFNCHGSMYDYFLNQSQKFTDSYKTTAISVIKYLNDKPIILSKEDINIFKNADLLIIQYLRTYQELNKYITSIIKIDCQIITLPHYRSSIYEFFLQLPKFRTNIPYASYVPLIVYNCYIENKGDYNEFKKAFPLLKHEINKILCKKSFDEYHIKCLNEFKILETEQSDINMHSFVVENYKKIKLFGLRSYPRHYFFYVAVTKILEKININDIIPFNKCNIPNNLLWRHTIFPIPDFITELAGYCFTTNEIYLIKPDNQINNVEDYFYKVINMSPNNELLNQGK